MVGNIVYVEALDADIKSGKVLPPYGMGIDSLSEIERANLIVVTGLAIEKVYPYHRTVCAQVPLSLVLAAMVVQAEGIAVEDELPAYERAYTEGIFGRKQHGIARLALQPVGFVIHRALSHDGEVVMLRLDVVGVYIVEGVEDCLCFLSHALQKGTLLRNGVS